MCVIALTHNVAFNFILHKFNGPLVMTIKTKARHLVTAFILQRRYLNKKMYNFPFIFLLQ
jgi:hypothetical protein